MSVAEITEVSLERSPPTGLWRDAFRQLRRNPGALFGLFVIGFFFFVAIFAPLLAPYDPREQNLELIATGVVPARRASICWGSTTSVATSSLG